MIPEIAHSTIFIEQPSTKEKLSMRRYIVREERILLFAKESKDINDVFRAIKDVVSACVLDKPKDFDINEWPLFDLEYVFLQLRSQSVNNIEDFKITDVEDEREYTLFVEFDKIEMLFDENAPSNKIKVNDQITIVMRYPKASIYDDIDIKNKLKTEGLFPLVVDCVDQVFNYDEAVEMTKKEKSEFVDSLDVKTFEKIKEFLFSTPTLKYTVSYINSFGNEKFLTFNSLVDFFLYL